MTSFLYPNPSFEASNAIMTSIKGPKAGTARTLHSSAADRAQAKEAHFLVNECASTDAKAKDNGFLLPFAFL